MGFGIERRMSRKSMQIKFILAEFFWMRSELELINYNQNMTFVRVGIK